jgi:hypothetical protein
MARHVLVWDAPNIDMTVANIIDGKPTPKDRPDLQVLGDWLVAQALPTDDVEACVFINVAPHVAGAMRGWVLWLLETGFRVFAKPKDGDSDVDDDMLDHLHDRLEEGDVAAVYVGSNDARNFLEPLEDIGGQFGSVGLAHTDHTNKTSTRFVWSNGVVLNAEDCIRRAWVDVRIPGSRGGPSDTIG